MSRPVKPDDMSIHGWAWYLEGEVEQLRDMLEKKLHSDQNVRGKTETSRKASLNNLPRSGSQRARVLNHLMKFPTVGATDEEMVDVLKMSPNSLRPRRNELVEGGWVRDTGKTRKTSTGNDATVWVPTRAAWESLR